MPAIKNKTLGAFAAGLMAATALVTTVSVLPATQAVAQNQLKADAVDPSKGFADLVDKVMPAVVSVQVKYANAAASGAFSDAPSGRVMATTAPTTANTPTTTAAASACGPPIRANLLMPLKPFPCAPILCGAVE